MRQRHSGALDFPLPRTHVQHRGLLFAPPRNLFHPGRCIGKARRTVRKLPSTHRRDELTLMKMPTVCSMPFAGVLYRSFSTATRIPSRQSISPRMNTTAEPFGTLAITLGQQSDGVWGTDANACRSR